MRVIEKNYINKSYKEEAERMLKHEEVGKKLNENTGMNLKVKI